MRWLSPADHAAAGPAVRESRIRSGRTADIGQKEQYGQVGQSCHSQVLWTPVAAVAWLILSAQRDFRGVKVLPKLPRA
jgi:hypothetical protein